NQPKKPINKSNDYSNIEITPENQNNSKRRNSSNLGTTGRRNQYPTTANSRYQENRTETWRKYNDPQERMTEVSEKLQMSFDPKQNLDEESVSQRTSDNNEKTMDIRATSVPGNSYTNCSSTRLLQVPNRTTYESRTTTPEGTGSVQCKICSGTLGQHEYCDCPNAIYNKCRETGHTHRNCPHAPLLKNGS
ncbi:14867_t:CDS:2, partial [Cetraspora pellucida]